MYIGIKVKLKTSKMALKGQKTTSDFLEWDKMQSIVLKLERDNDPKFALLRISDLLQLRWNQVLGQEYFTITEKKTKKIRTITINPELQTILSRLFIQLQANENDLMFVNRFGEKPFSIQYVNSKLKDIFAKYKVRGQYSSHFMRKTLGRRIWEVNKYSDQALLLLSQLFNHASVSTTKIYLGIREQEISNLYLSL
jgi:integrase